MARRCTDEHPDWACDDWDACAAEISCALTVGHGRASGQMDLAVTLRDRLPHIGALFLAGDLPTRTVDTITRRTALVTDHDALAALDTHLAERSRRTGDPCRNDKLRTGAVDAAVQRHDPAAVRRTRYTTRGRDFTIGDPNDATGTTSVWGRLSTARRRPPPDRASTPWSTPSATTTTRATPRRDAFGTALAVHATALAPLRQHRRPRRTGPNPTHSYTATTTATTMTATVTTATATRDGCATVMVDDGDGGPNAPEGPHGPPPDVPGTAAPSPAPPAQPIPGPTTRTRIRHRHRHGPHQHTRNPGALRQPG